MSEPSSLDRLEQRGHRWTFNDRPSPLPAELRPVWRISVILLVLRMSRAKSASLLKLHFATWALRDRALGEDLIRSLETDDLADAPLPRIDPALNRAVDLAMAEGLMEIAGKKSLKLSEKGLSLSNELDNLSDCLVQEKELLSQLAPYLAESAVDQLFKRLAST